MIPSLKELLVDWSLKHGERAKMQHAYIVVSLAGFVVAGLVGLLNYDTSRTLLRLSFYGLAVFAVNAVMWALLSGFVLNKLPVRRAGNRK